MRTERISIRVTPEEKTSIVYLANLYGLTITDFILFSISGSDCGSPVLFEPYVFPEV